MATIGDVRPGLASSSYALLGLKPHASAADVRRAYRRLVMRLHPDHAGNDRVAEFLAIRAAYESLLAHPRAAEPNPRRTQPSGGIAVYRPRRPFRPAAPVPRPEWRDRGTGWAGGRWYWEGLGANAARRAQRERAG